MAKLSEIWKKAKDSAEKLCKQKQKEGRKAEFPKFKSDFQKNLDAFEAAGETVTKLKEKLYEEGKKLNTLGNTCLDIIKEYEQAIDRAEVEGLKSKDEVKSVMLEALKSIRSSVDRNTPKVAKDF